MRCVVDACERNVADMRAIFEPGVTEVELWATLQRSNWLRYGEWMETRIMASGGRTNPWYHEASAKPVAVRGWAPQRSPSRRVLAGSRHDRVEPHADALSAGSGLITAVVRADRDSQRSWKPSPSGSFGSIVNSERP